MASTGLKYGPYRLTTKSVEDKVTKVSPGVYALDRRDISGKFYVNYVGRSDRNVRERLLKWVGTKYKKFKFDYFDSPKAAFEKECTVYHDFGGPEGKMDNENHPQRPEGTDWQCPKCDIFKSQ